MGDTDISFVDDRAGIIKHSFFMAFSSSMTGILNYLFQIYMSRSLTASEFGALGALISLLSIVSIPLSAIQTATAKYVSNLKAKGKIGDAAALFFRSLRKIAIISLLGLLVFLLLSRPVSSYLRMDSVAPTIILGFALFLSAFLPALNGTLQGFQKFVYIGSLTMGGAFIRLVSGVALVSLGFGVSGGVGAFVISGALLIVFAFVPLRFLYSIERSGDVDSREVYAYFVPVIISLSCLAVLSNVDSIIVKHYFHPKDAGVYLKASIVGKTFFYLPMSFVMVLFPKASESHSLGRRSLHLLKLTILISLVAAGVGMVICFYGSETISGLIGKDEAEFGQIGALIRYFGIAITPIALVGITMYYNLALHRTRFVYYAVPGTLIFMLSLIVFHSSFWDILWAIGICGWVMFGIFLSLTLSVEDGGGSG